MGCGRSNEKTAQGMRSVGVEVRQCDGEPINVATEDTLSQLVMDVGNAIDQTAYDLNAAPFSATTNITKDYELDSVEFNFTTTATRTITVTTQDGTKVLNEVDNTDTSFTWQPASELAYSANDNLTVDVTQAGSACSMDCILRIKSGTSTLTGNPYVGWLDTGGTERGFQLAGSGRPRVSIVDYGHEISADNLTGHVHDWDFGERALLSAAAGGEDIWLETATKIPFPSVSGEQMVVVSTSAQDGAGGTGVIKFKFDYIDSSGNIQTEEVTTNGTTPLNTTATDIVWINHMYTTEVGSNGVAVGDITMYKIGDATTVYNLIKAGGNKDLTCAMRIPTDKTFFINEWHGAVTGNKPTALRLRSTDWNNTLYNGTSPIFIFKDTVYLGEGTFDRNFDPPIRVPGGTTIKVTAWATQANGYVSASINGFYE